MLTVKWHCGAPLVHSSLTHYKRDGGLHSIVWTELPLPVVFDHWNMVCDLVNCENSGILIFTLISFLWGYYIADSQRFVTYCLMMYVSGIMFIQRSNFCVFGWEVFKRCQCFQVAPNLIKFLRFVLFCSCNAACLLHEFDCKYHSENYHSRVVGRVVAFVVCHAYVVKSDILYIWISCLRWIWCESATIKVQKRAIQPTCPCLCKFERCLSL